jgi:hypothetical protein
MGLNRKSASGSWSFELSALSSWLPFPLTGVQKAAVVSA